MQTENPSGSSSSLKAPDYWWYRARGTLLQTVFASGLPDGHILDVGSADGPSVGWLPAGQRIPLDIDIRGLSPGGLCASVLQLPFPDGTLDAICAFDVIEHVPDEHEVLTELARVLRPGGRLFLAVPAYQWAWTAFDVRSGHYRRYTKQRLTRGLEGAGLEVERATYSFASTFPFFAIARVYMRLRRPTPESAGVPQVPRWLDTALARLTQIDKTLLRFTNLPFGSSVFAQARLR